MKTGLCEHLVPRATVKKRNTIALDREKSPSNIPTNPKHILPSAVIYPVILPQAKAER